MATVKDIKKGFCDDVYTELEYVKERIVTLRDKLARTYGAESNLCGLSERHLCELVDHIDWKLQILSYACPYEWKGSAEYEENSVSVGPAEKFPTDFSGGYVGG